jgi:hypothetical protein
VCHKAFLSPPKLLPASSLCTLPSPGLTSSNAFLSRSPGSSASAALARRSSPSALRPTRAHTLSDYPCLSPYSPDPSPPLTSRSAILERSPARSASGRPRGSSAHPMCRTPPTSPFLPFPFLRVPFQPPSPPVAPVYLAAPKTPPLLPRAPMYPEQPHLMCHTRTQTPPLAQIPPSYLQHRQLIAQSRQLRLCRPRPPELSFRSIHHLRKHTPCLSRYHPNPTPSYLKQR